MSKQKLRTTYEAFAPYMRRDLEALHLSPLGKYTFSVRLSRQIGDSMLINAPSLIHCHAWAPILFLTHKRALSAPSSAIRRQSVHIGRGYAACDVWWLNSCILMSHPQSPLTTLQLARHLHSRAASPDRSTSSEKALKNCKLRQPICTKMQCCPPPPLPNHPVSRPERRRHHDITFAPAQLASTHFPRKSYRQCPFSPSYSAHLHTPCRRIQPRQHLCNPKDGPRSNNRITR